jgi:hypothetical protein
MKLNLNMEKLLKVIMDSKRSGLLRSRETRLTQWVGGEVLSDDTCLPQLGRRTIGIGVLHRERIRDNEGAGPSPAPSPFRAGPARRSPRADHVPPVPPTRGGVTGEGRASPPEVETAKRRRT